MRKVIPKNAIMVPRRATCMFKGHIFDTYQWEEKMFDGSAGTFEMLKRPDSVEVLVVHENKLLLQRQEQPFIGKFFSFPGGRHDHEEESELDAAKRELKEEAGYVCANWRLVRAIQPHQKIESFWYTFLAWDIVEQVPQALDVGEKIENMWEMLENVRTMTEGDSLRIGTLKLLSDFKEADELLTLPEYRA